MLHQMFFKRCIVSLNQSPILKQFVIFLALAASVALSTSFIFIDVLWLHTPVKEISLTEISQELFLLANVAIFIYCARRSPGMRGGLLLIAGFYAALLIRELDGFFDMLHHGAWLWFALASTALFLILAANWQPSVKPGLLAFIQHPCFAHTTSGMVVILVFSRLFGMSELWGALLQDGYLYTVKTAIEEGTELVGYTLCLFSSAWFALSLLPQRQVALQTAREARVTRFSSGRREPEVWARESASR